ncbi:Protein CBG05970 [Caenorhabditis briggsae]|uniref:Protein CBG05970 n=1 Tax=Caenorhabditis briggsae TaxID=6238 RepID=A8X175_CAEBR|nr:Protein CBG05970 [Caenorhabditis briggsae]CAP26385.1 Protein CBG05970 [Caenorhabditis briggsae]
MSTGEAPGTCTELHDCRDVIGTGSSIDTIKFHRFHMFDTDWKLKLHIDWAEELGNHVLSLRMRHQRYSVDDIWNLNATIRIQVNEKWLKTDTVVETEFSNRKREITIADIGRMPEEVNYVTCVHLKVSMQTLSMASPVFLEAFAEALDTDSIEICNVSPRDFRRILNMIYPPHLPPKRWIKENNRKKQLELIYHLLAIAKALKCPIVFEVADKWLVKHGSFNLEDSLMLAQTFGLRELMGYKIATIQSVDDLRECRDQIDALSNKTKALILDHLLFST